MKTQERKTTRMNRVIGAQLFGASGRAFVLLGFDNAVFLFGENMKFIKQIWCK